MRLHFLFGTKLHEDNDVKKFNTIVSISLFGFGLTGIPDAVAATADDYLIYTAVPGCRVLDTRKWNQTTAVPIPTQQAVNVALSDKWGDIPGQGGDPAGCPSIPDDAVAFAVTVSAIAPTFPASSFSGAGFATILPYALSDWTEGAEVIPPDGNTFWTYDNPPFNQSATVLFDNDTDIIANTTTVKAADLNWHAFLYTSTASHFTVDVVGYYTSLQQILDDLPLLP
jgi:hypothetical protein